MAFDVAAWYGAIGFGLIISTKNFPNIITAVACSAILSYWHGSDLDTNGNIV